MILACISCCISYNVFVRKNKRKGNTLDAKTYEELVNKEQAINRVCETCHDFNGAKYCDIGCPFTKAQCDLVREWGKHKKYTVSRLIEHICYSYDECYDCLFYSNCSYAHGLTDDLEKALLEIEKEVIAIQLNNNNSQWPHFGGVFSF